MSSNYPLDSLLVSAYSRDMVNMSKGEAEAARRRIEADAVCVLNRMDEKGETLATAVEAVTGGPDVLLVRYLQGRHMPRWWPAL